MTCILLHQQEVQIQSKHKEIEELKRQEASRQQRILQAKEALAAAKLELESVAIYEAPKSELVSIFSYVILLIIFCLSVCVM